MFSNSFEKDFKILNRDLTTSLQGSSIHVTKFPQEAPLYFIEVKRLSTDMNSLVLFKDTVRSEKEVLNTVVKLFEKLRESHEH